MKHNLHKAASLMLASVLILQAAPVTANDLDDASAVAGMSVTINNYSAGNEKPVEDINTYLTVVAAGTADTQRSADSLTVTLVTDAAVETSETEAAVYPVISTEASVQMNGIVSVLGSINVRSIPSLTGDILGTLQSNNTVDVYDTVSNEEGNWYLVSSGELQGYVSADYIVTAISDAAIQSNITNRIATVTVDSLSLKDAAKSTASDIGEIHKDETYAVTEIQGDYVKLRNGDYVIGYASMSGLKVTASVSGTKVEDAAVAENFANYMTDINFSEAEYYKRMAAGDYYGAYMAADYAALLWSYYINYANDLGLTEVAESAMSELASATTLKETSYEMIPETTQAVETTAVAAETAPTAVSSEEIMVDTAEIIEAPVIETTAAPAVAVTGIEARYAGAPKTEGEVIYSNELYVHVYYSNGTEADVTEGWSSSDVGMILSGTSRVVTMSYAGYSSSFELPISPAPTQAPAETAAAAPAETAAAAQPAADIRAQVVNYALSWVGRCSYVWGAANLADGGAVDCSGFTMLVYGRVAGISMSHYSMDQLNYGTAISYEQLRPGDLVVYPRHVGIYIGDGMIVHAKNANAGIVTDSVFFKAGFNPVGYRSLLP